MTTLRDAATAMGLTSVRAMAHALGLASPFSARQVMTAFLVKAQPLPPTNLLPVGGTEGYPVMLPGKIPLLGVTFTWLDPGAQDYWRATRYHFELEQLPPDAWDLIDIRGVTAGDVTSPSRAVTSTAFQVGRRFSWGVTSANAFGKSVRVLATFVITAPPSASAPSQHPPAPNMSTGPSAILFWNCDYPNHVTVTFYLNDLTAGGTQTFNVAAGYNESGMCGPNITDPTTIPLVANHEYAWAIVSAATGNQLWSGPAVGGTNPPVPLVWPPS